jgi:hypothetical protein
MRHKKVWKFKIVENPLEFQNGLLQSSILVHQLNDTWFGGQKQKILTVKSSDNILENYLFQETDILYNQAVIQTSHRYITEIPVFKIKNKNRILCRDFHNLDSPSSNYKFTMMFGMEFTGGRQRSTGQRITPPNDEIQQLRRHQALQFAERAASAFLQSLQEPVANINTEFQEILERNRARVRERSPSSSSRIGQQTSQPSTQIPQHIVNSYIEGLIQKGECCPITLTTLQKDNTCITPCGHAMLLHSVEHWIRDAHSCPVCRLPVSENQLQVWKP